MRSLLLKVLSFLDISIDQEAKVAPSKAPRREAPIIASFLHPPDTVLPKYTPQEHQQTFCPREKLGDKAMALPNI